MLFTEHRRDSEGPQGALTRRDLLLARLGACCCVVSQRCSVGSVNSTLSGQRASSWTAGNPLTADKSGYCGHIFVFMHNSYPNVQAMTWNRRFTILPKKAQNLQRDLYLTGWLSYLILLVKPGLISLVMICTIYRSFSIEG
jgi:hypothetical protein